MNKIINKAIAISVVSLAGVFTACNEYTPDGYEAVPSLPTVTNISSSVSDRTVTISWDYPSTSLNAQGVNIIVNNDADHIISLDNGVTSYTVKGQPMDVEYMYTVKMRYQGENGKNYVSEGQTVTATVPFEQLADVTSFEITNIDKKAVTFSWTLPNAAGITGVMISQDGQASGTVFEGTDVTTGTLNGQMTGVDLRYRIQVIYDGYYYSPGVTIDTNLPKIETKPGFLLLADSPAQLPDDDEVAAAAWFYDNYVTTGKGNFITVDELSSIDFDEYGVIWIMVDRAGLEAGWQNLPENLVSSSTLELLKQYSAGGGSLYLSNMATQLTVPLNIVPANMPINSFASGAGGVGDDIWTMNTHLGWIFRPEGPNAGEQGYYDRTSHVIFEGLTWDNSIYEWSSIPLIGPGQREDHNCLWDLNPYWNAAGNPAPDCVNWFENTVNCTVLGIWGQVQDHCIAGLVEFNANATHGRCMAMGLAAYEWNQNTNPNPYQGNIEQLTVNILNYLQ